jgi:2-methylcitrate dehydratase PrpD
VTVIGELADYVSGTRFSDIPPATVENTKKHILDTLGAMLIGPRSREGELIGKLLATLTVKEVIPVIGYSHKTSLLPSVLAGCASTRCSEFDDIHLQACVTPGSIIIPTAFSLANSGYFSNPEDFLTAVVIGYDIFIRFGMAIEGPLALYEGIWPTHLGAALGACVVTSRALMLTPQQTASAISAVLSVSTGVEGKMRPGGPSSRWLTIGIDAQNGVISALAALEGFMADDNFLDQVSDRTYGHQFSPLKMTEDLKKRFLIDETGMKPYPAGRQGLSAIEAFRQILSTNSIDPESIQAIVIRVPKRFLPMLQRPATPLNRLSSLGAYYQIALAAFAPEILLDPGRENLPWDPRFDALMGKITVKASRSLDPYYPVTWPAGVEIKTQTRRYSCRMLHPKGDSDNSLTWEEITAKYLRAVEPLIGRLRARRTVSLIRSLDSPDSLSQLLKVLTKS